MITEELTGQTIIREFQIGRCLTTGTAGQWFPSSASEEVSPPPSAEGYNFRSDVSRRTDRLAPVRHCPLLIIVDAGRETRPDRQRTSAWQKSTRRLTVYEYCGHGRDLGSSVGTLLPPSLFVARQ